MTAYVALLRAVNVGGRKLLMADLRQIAEQLGLGNVRTYIASGNLLFTSGKTESALRQALEKELAGHMGKPVGVIIRTAAEMKEVARSCPFDVPGNRAVAIFLNEPPAADSADRARHVASERIAIGTREIYVHYPDGQGPSKLVIPAAASGTARNMNSVATLARMAKEME